MAWPSDFPNLAKDLIKQLLVVDPKKRLKIGQITRHPWFQCVPQLRPVAVNKNFKLPCKVRSEPVFKNNLRPLDMKQIYPASETRSPLQFSPLPPSTVASTKDNDSSRSPLAFQTSSREIELQSQVQRQEKEIKELKEQAAQRKR